LLINVTKNAVEACMESQPDGRGQVVMGWQTNDSGLEIWVEDNGPGLKQDSEVFVPFFTTKRRTVKYLFRSLLPSRADRESAWP
jgi:C4-dicarboxylate-specific signal transduction histidine kinase